MFLVQILLYPFDQMVLECTFDDLVEKVRCNQFIDIGMGEIIHEWHKLPNNTILMPESVKRKVLY